jgi:hypothetical protein
MGHPILKIRGTGHDPVLYCSYNTSMVLWGEQYTIAEKERGRD